MDAVTMIKERRSVRKYKDEKVSRDVIMDILTTATYAPTCANSQTVRYTVIDDKATISKLANEGMNGFKFNEKTLSNASGVIVVSNVKGKCGTKPEGVYVTAKGSGWEMYDAGVASQTLCLAAHEKGVGTVIMGIFDEDKVAEIIGLPKDETVSAVIPYGYIVEPPNMPKRKPVEEVVRFL